VAHATEIDKAPLLLPLLAAAEQMFGSVELRQDQARDIVHGKRIELAVKEMVAATWNGELLAVLEPAGSQAKSVVVFPEVFNA
jgi:NOL1/NOP2/fmu family ribosome biogenesis protein